MEKTNMDIRVNSVHHITGNKGKYFNFYNVLDIETNDIVIVKNKHNKTREVIIWRNLNSKKKDDSSNAHGRYVHNPKDGDFKVGDILSIISIPSREQLIIPTKINNSELKNNKGKIYLFANNKYPSKNLNNYLKNLVNIINPNDILVTLNHAESIIARYLPRIDIACHRRNSRGFSGANYGNFNIHTKKAKKHIFLTGIYTDTTKNIIEDICEKNNIKYADIDLQLLRKKYVLHNKTYIFRRPITTGTHFIFYFLNNHKNYDIVTVGFTMYDHGKKKIKSHYHGIDFEYKLINDFIKRKLITNIT